MQCRRADIGAVPFFQRTDTLSDTVTPHCKDPGIRHRTVWMGVKLREKCTVDPEGLFRSSLAGKVVALVSNMKI